MEQDQMSGPAPQKRFSLWLIATIVLAVLLIASGIVFAWQKSAGNKAKDNLQSQINTLQSQVQQLTNVAPTNNNQCVAEGESGGTESTSKLTNCCAGLSKVDRSGIFEGICENASGQNIEQWFTCIKCGNGVCGTGENKCNCPADCKDNNDETVGWSSYINTKYGFEFKYPQEKFSAKDWSSDSNGWDMLVYIGNNSKIGDGFFSIGIQKGVNSIEKYFFIMSQGSETPYVATKEKNFENVFIGTDKYPAKRFSYRNRNLNIPIVTIDLYLVEHAETLYQILYQAPTGVPDPITEKDFNLILSTLRFTK